MTIQEAVLARHSVRSYTDAPIEGETLRELEESVSALNAESGLSMQLIRGDGKPFGGLLAMAGWLAGVKNYIAIVGPDSPDLDERCGYFGEKLVLRAQQLGLNTCWVAGTYNKGKCTAAVKPGEKLALVITIGYGKNQGKPRKSKSLAAVCDCPGEMPDWFRRGAEFALLAPTAVNQQQFKLKLLPENRVHAAALIGAYSRIDLGIVKCHFEIGAGEGGWSWSE
ncbi:MAG: nitroreductase [Clostridia bacterium]|nr:nitroreductase [Clostridia bacterium]